MEEHDELPNKVSFFFFGTKEENNKVVRLLISVCFFFVVVKQMQPKQKKRRPSKEVIEVANRKSTFFFKRRKQNNTMAPVSSQGKRLPSGGTFGGGSSNNPTSCKRFKDSDDEGEDLLLPDTATTDGSSIVTTQKSERNSMHGKEDCDEELMGGKKIRLCTLPEEVLCNITSYLDVASLLKVREVNRSYRMLASQKSAGWGNLCHELWKDKVHVCSTALQHPDPMAAYRISTLDARTRQYVSRDELIYDPDRRRGTVWSFRFKESAGPDWTSWDPWYSGQPCRKMVFLGDGSVKQYTDEALEDDGGGTISNPTFSQQQQQGQQQNGEGTLLDPPLSMTWRFLTRPLDLPARPMGSYVRFAVGGRDVPTYCVQRSPTNNWGFIMESCWGVYASFELPKRPTASSSAATATGTGPSRQGGRRRRRLRTRRAHDNLGNPYNVEVMEDDETDDEAGQVDDNEGQQDDEAEQEEQHQQDGPRVLIDDESFTITSGLQWREAFLYNFGARILPEGDEAVAQFEQTYGEALSM